MRFVAERIRPLYLAELGHALLHLAAVGEGQRWLTATEAAGLRRLAFTVSARARKTRAGREPPLPPRADPVG